MLKRYFFKIAILNILTIYLLILAGGIVRSTGSGMGCPDWPKCFGSYIPPTTIKQLPQDYKSIYLKRRIAKNERLAVVLRSISYEKLAYRLEHEDFVMQEQDFNVTKTWIEYINRLLGALLGFFIILLVVFSFGYWKQRSSVVVLSLCSFILVCFQGWVGSIVVSSNLLPGLITFHMLMAILMMGLLIWIAYEAYGLKYGQGHIIISKKKMFLRLVLLVIGLQVLQVAFGTQVRETVDALGRLYGNGNRANWIESIGSTFIIHRSFSWLLVGCNGFLIYRLLRDQQVSIVIKISGVFLLLFIILEILAGVGMAYFGIPPYLQPLHLLLATFIFGIQVFLFLAFKFAVQKAQSDGI